MSSMNRRVQLLQARKEEAERFAVQTAALKKEEELKKLESTFKTDQSHTLESQFKSDTVGLLSASEFRQKKAQIDLLRSEAEKRKLKEIRKQSKKKQRINVIAVLAVFVNDTVSNMD
uniref:Uncharacterized protein n=1 Tax=Spongospora subterranea TaxID=70186 RepID=A0A0H5R1B4_9EUKA|eukprot:CRZ01594.1 hypothetical protein [Spongospora subterranea]